jgi:predicted transcriptional regulator
VAPAQGKHKGLSPNSRGDRDLASVDALVSDRAECQILVALGDGVTMPAGRLAMEAGISPATASSLLRKLVDGGRLVVESAGRCRNYRLADPGVTTLIEALERLAPTAGGQDRGGDGHPGRLAPARDARLGARACRRLGPHRTYAAALLWRSLEPVSG